MGLFPKAVSEYLALMGIPRSKNSQIFIVDPLTGGPGSDSNTGLSFSSPLATVQAAFAKCTTNQNDCVVMVGGPTESVIAAEINWNLDYTHLVGMSANLPGLGTRCRVFGNTTVDAVQVMHITGNGCIFKNICFVNETDADADNGAVLLTGDRCMFENCDFRGMVHDTPAARAGAFSLTLTGAVENYFLNCAIGTDTITRAAANSELILQTGSSKNTFERCRFMSRSMTAGKFLVTLDTTVASGLNEFVNCLFYNNSTNWGTQINNAFCVTGGGSTYYLVIRGPDTILVGPVGWGDVVTHMYHNLGTPTNVGGIPVSWTT